MSQNEHSKGHFIDVAQCIKVGVALLVLTVITVATARVDLGMLNFPIAMLIATTKALLVILFFMNQLHEPGENRVIFFASFLFLAIFIVLTFADLFTRGDVYRPLARTGNTFTMGSAFKEIAGGGGPAKFKKPWNSSPEILLHGKGLFQNQCVSCHGAEGKGDGAASAALNPKPRNFTVGDGWKQGRKQSQVFETITKGVPGSAMSSFSTLSPEDRFALAHYVLSMGPPAPADTAQDLKTAGVDTSKEMMGAEPDKSTPIAKVFQQMAKEQSEVLANEVPVALVHHEGRPLYEAKCASCHGIGGGGAVFNVGLFPRNTLHIQAFRGTLSGASEFSHVVRNGIPGNLMPGHAELSDTQMGELYSYVKGLSGK